MSAAVIVPPGNDAPAAALLPIEENRGMYGMYTVIATELSLFICLFASYYFLGGNKQRWTIDQPPKLHYALIMLAVLLSSSFVLAWGERQLKRQRYAAARVALIATVLIGLGFLTLQAFEYLDHWKTLTPYSDSYGSVFYTITTFHAAHVVMGLLMLAYVGVLPIYGPTLRPPYRPYSVVALYWHFVDFVWIFIVALLYVVPNIQAYGH